MITCSHCSIANIFLFYLLPKWSRQDNCVVYGIMSSWCFFLLNMCTKGSGNPIYPLIFIFIFFSFYFWVQKHPNSFYGTVHGYCSHSPWTVPDEFYAFPIYPLFAYFFAYEFLLFFFLLFLFGCKSTLTASLVLFTGTVQTTREQYQMSFMPLF